MAGLWEILIMLRLKLIIKKIIQLKTIHQLIGKISDDELMLLSLPGYSLKINNPIDILMK